MSITGLTIRHVGERFQHSNDTISKYFKRVLRRLCHPGFYHAYIHLPKSHHPIPNEILADTTWFYLYFKNCVGAIDGTHISLYAITVEDHETSRNRK
ncbi:hypothetical protein OBBRIDRAFT_710498, partial [Obba rivulosa]